MDSYRNCNQAGQTPLQNKIFNKKHLNQTINISGKPPVRCQTIES